MANRAIWIGKDHQLSLREINEVYEPLTDEVLVEVEYSGINPADIVHSPFGFNDYPAGYDFAGRVVKSGANRREVFKPGDRVLGFGAPEQNKAPQYGVHQRFHCARHFIHHVPSSMPMADAACLMVVTHTASDALFNQLEVPLPRDDQGICSGSEENRFPILIWGGASAVGSAAVQLAKMAGCYPILTTASKKNHDALRALGATECFDYRDKDIVDQIQRALQRHNAKPLNHVLDAVVSHKKPSSTSICEQLAGQGARLTAPVPVAGDAARTWKQTFACRNVVVTFELPSGEIIRKEPVPEWQLNIDWATRWAIEHYGSGYRMSNVTVVKGGHEGMKAMMVSADGGASMQKFVIQHPI